MYLSRSFSEMFDFLSQIRIPHVSEKNFSILNTETSSEEVKATLMLATRVGDSSCR